MRGASATSFGSSWGAFKLELVSNNGINGINTALLSDTLELDASLVVSAGPEFSPRTLSVAYWRKIA